MKQIIFSFIFLFSITAFAGTPAIDEKIEKQFKEMFPTAQKVKWFEYNSFYEVLFEHNKINCRMTYNTEGELISVRRDYTEKDLSLYILGAVKQKYPGKKVFGVTELNSAEGLTYTIVLEDDKTWTIVKSDSNGQMGIVKRMKKA